MSPRATRGDATLARDNGTCPMGMPESKPVRDAYFAPPALRLPIAFKLLAAAAVSLMLWAGILWLVGQVTAWFS